MKLKTRKSALKRIKKKGILFVRKMAYKGHLLRKKSSSQLRRLSKPSIINIVDKKAMKLMLPYFCISK